MPRKDILSDFKELEEEEGHDSEISLSVNPQNTLIRSNTPEKSNAGRYDKNIMIF